MLGFVRITTNRRVVARPLPVQRVMEQLQAWLALPHVHIAQPSNTHFERLRAELERLGTAGNLTTDWPYSLWSAGIFYIRPIRNSPALAVFTG